MSKMLFKQASKWTCRLKRTEVAFPINTMILAKCIQLSRIRSFEIQETTFYLLFILCIVKTHNYMKIDIEYKIIEE